MIQLVQWRSTGSNFYLLLGVLVGVCFFCIFSWFIDFLVEQALGPNCSFSTFIRNLLFLLLSFILRVSDSQAASNSCYSLPAWQCLCNLAVRHWWDLPVPNNGENIISFEASYPFSDLSWPQSTCPKAAAILSLAPSSNMWPLLL